MNGKTPPLADRRKTSADQLGPIQRDVVYPLRIFRSLSGLGPLALRRAEKRGLPIRTVGKCRYVLGSDFLEFLNHQDPATDSDT